MTAHPLLPTNLRIDAQRRVFCFPHAGGGTAMFYRWMRYLPEDVVLVPMRMPGREDRRADTPYTNLAKLADDAAEAIASLDQLPSLFVGHSLGGYVAMEVAQRLLQLGQTTPQKLIVAACGAPRQGKPKNPIAQLPDDAFLEEVSKRYDGIPDAVRENPELLAMVLPPLRCDIEMIESYDYQPTEPLSIDILALGGTDDPGVAPHRLQEWQALTTGSFQMRLLPGGHFFLHPEPRRMQNSGTAPAPIAAVLNELPPPAREID